ncbi:cell division protein FtsW, lipid II flippase [Desulfotomaculum arcticum]|uniref:Cell division protein FtsW, lipid II flippase n=1 Tax=Desulfotruncus arcticus DSM 17038 TaxID=1121424 RepID=A0A1I2YKZ5_9FIRM|nr:FtsW/RodA/SpoVE family cell cycle protein [Desulfotruncus arcticus]SFH26029.1 cell division protein FtsW, lipid II flippase [Desulfotomaculum arcticum] [Desulfotruncus arcticus DSM 17038]
MYFIERQALFTVSSIHIFTKSLVFTVIGAVIAAGFYIFDYKKLEPYSRHIYWGTVSALVLATIFGQNFNGKHYLSLGGIYLDVTEISPLLLCLALAGVLNNWNWSQPIKWLQGFLLCVVPLILLVASNSLTAEFIYSITCITLLVASGAKHRYSLLMTGLMAVMIMMPFISAPHRYNQFIAFINPENNNLGSGFNVHNDFIFSYITVSLGWVAGGLLAALGIIFILRMMRIVAAVKTSYARVLISGFTAIFAVQFLWNILMNLGFAPVSGVGLPFISFGGSQLIFNGAAIGIISSIYRRRNVLESF